MPRHNLTEHSKYYRKTTSILWNYYIDEPKNPPFILVNNPSTLNYNADPITNSASFKYKISIIEKASNNDDDDDDDDDDDNDTNQLKL